MQAKPAQRPLWEAFAPNKMRTLRQELGEDERSELRLVAVNRQAELQAALAAAKTLPASPMRTALVAKYAGLVAGYEALLDKI